MLRYYQGLYLGRAGIACAGQLETGKGVPDFEKDLGHCWAVLATGLIMYLFHVQSLAQRRVSFDVQADRATDFFEQRAAQRQPSEKLVAVLDTDETSFSNYRELVNSNYVFDPKTFDA